MKNGEWREWGRVRESEGRGGDSWGVGVGGRGGGDSWGIVGKKGRESLSQCKRDRGRGEVVDGLIKALTCSKKASMALIAEFLLSLLLCSAHSSRQSYMYCRVM